MQLPPMIERVDQWIAKVKPFLPERSSSSTGASGAAVVSSTSASKSDALTLADSAVAAEVDDSLRGPVLQYPMAPVCGDVLPESVTIPSDISELTLEQALRARELCNKGCKGSGCSFCMGEWFVPKAVLSAKCAD